MKDDKIICFINGRSLELKISSNKFKILDSYFYPEFGKKRKNKCLKIDFDSNKLRTSFEICQ